MKKISLLVMTFFAVVYQIIAQQIERPDGKIISVKTIDSTVNKLLDTAEITGLQLGIINDDKIV